MGGGTICFHKGLVVMMLILYKPSNQIPTNQATGSQPTHHPPHVSTVALLAQRVVH